MLLFAVHVVWSVSATQRTDREQTVFVCSCCTRYASTFAKRFLMARRLFPTGVLGLGGTVGSRMLATRQGGVGFALELGRKQRDD